MFKVIGRALLEALFFIIMLPLRILVFIGAIFVSARYKITGVFMWSEYWKAFIKGVKTNWNREMHWIKTGEPKEIEL